MLEKKKNLLAEPTNDQARFAPVLKERNVFYILYVVLFLLLNYVHIKYSEKTKQKQKNSRNIYRFLTLEYTLSITREMERLMALLATDSDEGRHS